MTGAINETKEKILLSGRNRGEARKIAYSVFLDGIAWCDATSVKVRDGQCHVGASLLCVTSSSMLARSMEEYVIQRRYG